MLRSHFFTSWCGVRLDRALIGVLHGAEQVLSLAGLQSAVMTQPLDRAQIIARAGAQQNRGVLARLVRLRLPNDT